MMLQAHKMVDIYRRAVEDKKANFHVQVDRERVKAKMKERDESG